MHLIKNKNNNIFSDIFKDKKSVRDGFKPFKHKDGTPFSDVDYMELLGRTVLEKEKDGEEIDYNKYDFYTIKIAKQIVKEIDEGVNKNKIKNELSSILVKE